MPPAAAAPRSFREVLERVWWRLDRCLDRDMVEASALATAADAARCGAAFVIDHHSSPHAVQGSLETIAAAFARVGIACLPCYEMSDRDGEETRDRGLEETRARLASGKPCLVGLHASFTVGDRLLRDAVDLARRFDSGIHVHAAEDPVDQEETLARHGCRVIERLARAGALESGKTILAHCLHLSESERSLIASSRAWVAHNVESNLNNGVGLPSARGLGDRVMLGTDGMHSDMLRAVQMCYLVSTGAERCTPGEAYLRLRGAHRYAREAAFPGDGEDNLVVLDYPTRTDMTQANALSHFLYGLRSSHVHSLVAAGRLVLKDRVLTLVDESEIHLYARSQAARLWKMLERGT
jgi:cytosine/adenosine deaminase-related metal-dependent hydrolase